VKVLSLLLFALMVAPIAGAMPIAGLYSTGMNVSGGVDQSWSLAGGTAYVTQGGQFPLSGEWAANDASSTWISPQTSYVGAGGSLLSDALNTTYVYTLSFDLTGYDSDTAWFTYQLAGDNTVQGVTLNGNSIPGGAGGAWSGSALSSIFTADSGFLPGVNTLSVSVLNTDAPYGNPSGFRLNFVDSNVDMGQVPEPATFALVGLALLALPLIRRSSH